jgi:hypothetical protein
MNDDDNAGHQPSGEPTWEAEMARHEGMDDVLGSFVRPAMTVHKSGDATAHEIPERQEAAVRAALPYLRAEHAGLILGHPQGAYSMIAMAQRHGELPKPLPDLTLLQAVLGMRADFDRRIRRYAIPPQDGVPGRERFERLTALVSALLARLERVEADLDYQQTVLEEVVNLLGVREPVRLALEARRARDPKARAKRPGS